MRQQFLVGASTKHDGELSARPFSRWRLESAPRSSIATSNAPVSIVDLLTRISPYPDIRAHDGRADWVGSAAITSASNATSVTLFAKRPTVSRVGANLRTPEVVNRPKDG